MNTIIKRILCLAVCLLFPFAWADDIDKTLTFGIVSGKTKYLNPLFPEEKDFMSLTSLMYESLVEIDDNYMPKPRLAKNWEVSSDGASWIFYLRDDAKFSDGRDVTANDVIETIRLIVSLAEDKEQPKKTAFSSLRYFIHRMEASDPRTVKISTNRKNFGFIYAMTFPVLPADQLTVENPVGSGPYRVENFTPGELLMLSLKQGIGKTPYTPPFINVVMHEDNQALMSSYEFNRVESVLTRSLTAAQYRSNTSSLNFHYRTRQLETLLMNNNVLEFQDIKVREAIRYAINVDDLISYSYFDLAEKTDTPLYPGTWAYHENLKKQAPNIERANALLDEAGWIDHNKDGVREKLVDGKTRNLKLRFIVYEESDNNVRISTANQIASILKSIGIQCNKSFSADVLSYSDALARLRAGTFDLALVAYNMDSVPDPGFLLMKRNTGNFARYSSDEMDDLFKTLRKSPSQDSYRSTLYKIQELFYKDCPFICLYYRRGAILTRKLFTEERVLTEPNIFRGIVRDSKQ